VAGDTPVCAYLNRAVWRDPEESSAVVVDDAVLTAEEAEAGAKEAEATLVETGGQRVLFAALHCVINSAHIGRRRGRRCAVSPWRCGALPSSTRLQRVVVPSIPVGRATDAAASPPGTGNASLRSSCHGRRRPMLFQERGAKPETRVSIIPANASCGRTCGSWLWTAAATKSACSGRRASRRDGPSKCCDPKNPLRLPARSSERPEPARAKHRGSG